MSCLLIFLLHLKILVLIAQRNVTIRLGTYFLPKFPTGDLSPEDFLIQKSKEGLEERLQTLFPDPQVRSEKRKEYDDIAYKTELDVINKWAFPVISDRDGVYSVVKR